MNLNDFGYIYDHIEKDFAEGEYPPYDVLYKHLEDGVQKGLILFDGNRKAAYSICAEGKTNYVLVSLLAVYPEYRGRGIGTKFLEELKGLYAEKRGIIVEVEKPEAATNPEEKRIRMKRIEFYKKAGFYLISAIDYSIWDIPMHLMALPCKASKEEINESLGKTIYDIYLTLMGKRFINKMQFKRKP
jgi:GNAT superfamily N-acetyltransferase